MSFVPGWGRFSTNLLISKKSLHLLSLILKVWYSWLRLETVLSGQLKSFLGTNALDWRSLIACRIDINQLLRSDFVYCKPMSRRTVQKRVPNKQTRSEKAASISELAVNQQANAFWTTRLERHLVFGTVCSKRQVMFGTSSSERIRLLVYSKFANRWRFSRTRLFDRNAFFHRSSRHGSVNSGERTLMMTSQWIINSMLNSSCHHNYQRRRLWTLTLTIFIRNTILL